MLKNLNFCAVKDLLSCVQVYGTLPESISVPLLIKKVPLIELLHKLVFFADVQFQHFSQHRWHFFNKALLIL